MEDGAARVAGDGEEAFAAKNFFLFRKLLHEELELLDVERAVELEAERLDVVMMPRVQFVEKLRIDRELLIHVEGVHVEQLLEVHFRVVRAKHLRVRIQLSRLGFNAREVRLVHEVGLVEQEEIGHRDLLARRLGVGHLLFDLLHVHDGDDRVHPHELLERRDVQKRLRHRPRIGDARGFDEQVVEAALFQKVLHTLHQILPHRAAQAAVAHLQHFVLGAFDQRAIDADLADFIDDDGKLVAVLLLEDVVEQRGFPGAEKAGEDGDGDGFHGSAECK